MSLYICHLFYYNYYNKKYLLQCYKFQLYFCYAYLADPANNNANHDVQLDFVYSTDANGSAIMDFLKESGCT